MQSKARSVSEYLASLPPDRRQTLSSVREMIRRRLPVGYEEAMNWGMITYQVPLDRFCDTYNGQPLAYAALASQKRYCSLYLSCAYQDADAREALLDAFARAGRKANMGKSCIRFTKLDDLPLDAIGHEIARMSVASFIDAYEAARRSDAGGKSARKSTR